jgi:polysaccharide biosynthesis protein PslH
MKVLQLCHKPPLPKIDGGCVAISNVSEGLMHHPDIDLKILTVETHKHPFLSENYPKDFLEKTNIEAVYIDTHINLVDAYSSFITADSYNVIRFYSPSFDKRIAEILEENTFDIIHLESIFLTPYLHTIRRLSNAKIVLRAHNVEHTLWEKWSDNSTNIFKKIYLKYLYKKLKKYETAILNNVDAIAAISQLDAEIIEKLVNKPLSVVPVGIDLPENTQTENSSEKLKLYHIGAMDWLPNVEGVDWFIKNVWPILLKEQPNIELHLAGKNISSDYHMPHKRIYCHGEVKDAQEFILKQDIMIVPVKNGSGVRIKILEAMSLNKLIVSTSVGISGIPAQTNQDYLQANSAKEFAEKIMYGAKPEKYYTITKSARKFVEQNYSKTNVTEKLVDFYKALIR